MIAIPKVETISLAPTRVNRRRNAGNILLCRILLVIYRQRIGVGFELVVNAVWNNMNFVEYCLKIALHIVIAVMTSGKFLCDIIFQVFFSKHLRYLPLGFLLLR